jgi:hypothetical protein
MGCVRGLEALQEALPEVGEHLEVAALGELMDLENDLFYVVFFFIFLSLHIHWVKIADFCTM